MHKRSVKWLTGIGIVLVIIIAAAAWFLSSDHLKALIDSKGSGALGREMAIDGDFHITWNWKVPHVHAEKIRIGNMKGLKEPNMVEIDQLDFDIEIWKALRGRASLPNLKIVKPKIVLEKVDAKTKNWDFPTMSKAKAVSSATLPSDRHNFPVIGSLIISDGDLIYRDDTKKLDVDLTLDTAKAGQNAEKQDFTINGHGTLQDKTFNLTARGGSIELLRDTNKPYPLQFNLQMGQTVLAMQGTFTDPVKLTGINSTLDLKGDTMADLFYLTGIPLPPTPPYSLTGQLKKDKDLWSYSDFKGRVGDSDLNGVLNYDASKDRPVIKANLTSKLLSVDDLGGFVGAVPSKKSEAPKQQAEAQKRAESDRLLPDVPINLARLRSADMDITLNAAQLKAPHLPLKDMLVRFDLNDGLLTIDPLRFGMSDGQVGGHLIFNGRKDVPDVTIDLTLKNISLKGFFQDSRFAEFSSGRFGGHINLEGTGKSLADVLAVSNGRVTALMSGGKISKLIIEAAGLDAQNAAPLLLDQDQTTNIRCAVGDFAVKSGMLNSQIFVFDTNTSNINGTAHINLKDETMDAHILAHPKNPSMVSLRTPISITGKMKHPSIGLDPEGLAEKGGIAAVVSAVFPPAALLIPFIDLGLGKDSDCGGLIDEAKKHAQAAQAGQAAPAPDKPQSGDKPAK